MSVVVQKYGGSSVADVTRMQQVADRVMRTRREGHDVVVVVSAMGHTTDELLALAKQVSPNPDRRELDMLLTAGERIAMALLSMAIREQGGDAISFTGSQSGIVTNDRHVREVTTLGRGGSDTTAVAMAAALGADYCEICSDVDGVYTADPRVVPAAQRIGTLSYEETQELAESGARVLNAQAVEFAKDKGIAIYARATSGPLPGADPSADGTVVRRFPPRLPGAVVGVASERDVLVMHTSGDRLAAADGPRERPGPADRLALEVIGFLDDHRVAGKQLHLLNGRLAVVISRENLHEEGRVRKAIASRFGGSVHIVDTLGALSVIGAGINASFENMRRGSAALIGAGIDISGVSTSSFRITWMIDRATLADAVRLLHRTLIEKSEPVP